MTFRTLQFHDEAATAFRREVARQRADSVDARVGYSQAILNLCKLADEVRALPQEPGDTLRSILAGESDE